MFLIATIILGCHSLYAQNIQSSLNFINYTLKDGLPSSETYDVFQDSKGFIWIGTDNGLVKYDGNEFKVFTTVDGLTDNTIFRIQEDYQGRIWFITYNRKLCYLENDKFHEYAFNQELITATKDIFIGNTITQFDVDSNDQSVKIRLMDFTHIYINPMGKVTIQKENPFISESYRSSFYSSNYHELVKNANLPSFKNSRFKKYTFLTELFHVAHIIKNDSILFVGAPNGLNLLLKNGALKTFLQGYYITGVEKDFEGGLWCSSLYSGLFYIPNFNLYMFNISKAKNAHVHAILPMINSLIFCYNKSSEYYVFTENDEKLKPYKRVLFFEEIDKSKFTSGFKFENPVYLEKTYMPVTAMTLLQDSTYLFACNKTGLIKPVDPTLFPNHFLDSVYNHSEVRKNYQGHTWHVSKNRDIMINKSVNELHINKRVNNFLLKVTKLLLDRNNQVWIGTPNGLYQYLEESKKVLKVDIPHPFVNYRIQDIVQTNDSTLVFGTKAHGIFMWKDSIITPLNVDSGLLSNTINQLVYDEQTNHIWVATNNGVSALSQDSTIYWTPTSKITKYDALETVDIRQIAIHDGFLFMANNTGVSKIALKTFEKSTPPPILFISGILVNEDDFTNSDSSLILPYDSNSIKISFHAISYKSQNDIRYSYKLDPVQENWESTTNNNAIFPALPHGDYAFTVKAKNVQGVESSIQTIHFTILPAFWMTLWFRVLAIFIILLLFVWMGKKVFDRYKKQVEFQRKLKEMQIVSLQSKMNPHFIFNSLNSIQNFILKNNKDEASSYLQAFSKLIRKTLQTSDSPYISLAEELNTLNMYINLEKRRVRNAFDFTVEIAPEIDTYACEIPSLLLQPYVENAIWHGKVHTVKNGKISLHITLNNNILNFEILDNGIGVSQSKKNKVFANSTTHKSLANTITSNRIKILSEMNANLSEVYICEAFEKSATNPNVGTRVTFSIPYNNHLKS